MAHRPSREPSPLAEVETNETEEAAAWLPKILYAEDDTLVARFMTWALEERGFEVVSVANGVEALVAATWYSFDVLLTDIDMPLMNGKELVNRMRKDRPDLPIVVLSGSSAETLEALRTKGGLTVLRKPSRIEEIVQVLKDAPASVIRDTDVPAGPKGSTKG
jgi:two-component system cell cycle response regulator CpdR